MADLSRATLLQIEKFITRLNRQSCEIFTVLILFVIVPQFAIIFYGTGLLKNILGNLTAAYILSGSILLFISWAFFKGIFDTGRIRQGWFLTGVLIALYGLTFFVSGSEFQPENIGNVARDFPSKAVKASWEEIVFRGALFAWLMPKFTLRNVLILGTLSNLAFTLTHIENYHDSMQADTYVMFVFLTGMVLFLVYRFTRNLIFPAVLHTMINAVNGLFFMDPAPLGSYPSTVIITSLALFAAGLTLLLRWQSQDPQPAAPSPPESAAG